MIARASFRIEIDFEVRAGLGEPRFRELRVEVFSILAGFLPFIVALLEAENQFGLLGTIGLC